MNDDPKIERMEIQQIPLDSLKDNPYDTREDFGDIESLAKSIEKRGLQNPISVVKINNFHYIVHGHRRSRAFRFLGRKLIPGIVRKESTPEDLMLDLAVENLQRKDLSPVEKGATLKQLFYSIQSVNKEITKILTLVNQVKVYERLNKVGGGFTEDDVKKARDFLNTVGMSVSTANIYLRILLLPEDIQHNVVKEKEGKKELTVPSKGKIGVKSAYELSRLTNPEIQRELADKIIKDKTSHQQVRHIVDNIIESDNTVARKGASGSRVDYEDNITKLTEELFALSSKIEYFRSKLPIAQENLDKIQWKASMDKMRNACIDMIMNINKLQREDMKIEDRLKLANSNIEVVVNRDLRFTLPGKIADILGTKEGDILLIKIEAVKKLPIKLIE